MNSSLKDLVEFSDPKFEKECLSKKMPFSEFVEGYIEGKVDLKVDFPEFLKQKDQFFKYSLITQKHLKFLVTKFVPEVAIHSKAQDIRIGREHYDRGNDFFGACLGDRMIYTSAFFRTGKETLEEAQDQKMELVCDKLRMSDGDQFLDIGCGWGTLAMYAAKNRGADSTGVTVAEHQTSFANNRIRKNNLQDNARVLCMDYRDIPNKKFDKISCLEMAEHVGVKHFQKFMKQIYNLLTDDGIFYLQIAGLRRGIHFEDLVWGLFMNKYIFPGADASMPLSYVTDKLEKAGFEIHSVENVGIHYSHTISRWYDNWMKHKEEITQKYGDRWYRIWRIFLAWSVQVAAQGSSTCFQIVCNKNLNSFDRTIWFGAKSELGEQRVRLGGEKLKKAPGAPTRRPPQPSKKDAPQATIH